MKDITTSIEDIVLAHDRRGISALQPHLPRNSYGRAADLVLGARGVAFIVTGFFSIDGGQPETDGPPGAVALAYALDQLGYRPSIVTDRYSSALLTELAHDTCDVLVFPEVEPQASAAAADEILARHQPSLLLSIERCGPTAAGTYLNLRGIDISPFNARLDALFLAHPRSIAIGDGGNEIGMGNLAEIIKASPPLPAEPCVTRVTELVIASVSNWGAYGLVTSLSLATGRRLLRDTQVELAAIERAVAVGAVDGTTGRNVAAVDGFSLAENGDVLECLQSLLSHVSDPAASVTQGRSDKLP